MMNIEWSLFLLILQVKKIADERTRTAYLCSLRVCVAPLPCSRNFLSPQGSLPPTPASISRIAQRAPGLRRERRGVEPHPLSQPCQQVEEGILGAPLWRPTELPPGTARVHNGGAEGQVQPPSTMG